ncbi:MULTISPECIES: restriction endonuclease subunit S [Micromonospora]|uniref:restriction endonuclease subunit S n=1 Tax=Micromonospora TaxID=1873 RepID=UPI001319F756|nr:MULTISPECIES: restriction endonuclease subunit S [Micromonospora]NES13369.1 restriction endonuclease subunit S [Micromonospora sp. PPF5-17B]NES39706.1 restriction endonuclease subunit S [Micromonospora solifontis]NES59153.1 restriction endonuclease subunit S [Micromonospora sp. PPF5-6]
MFQLERIPLDPDPSEAYVQIGIRSFGRGIFHRPAVAPEGLSKLRYFCINPGRIVFSNIMAWEGAIALTGSQDEGTVGSQRFLSYAPISREVSPQYYNYFFQTEAGLRLVRSGSTGTVKRNQTLSPRVIENFLVPFPSLDEQRRIASLLDSIIRVTEADSSTSQVEAALPSSFLSAAFSGSAPTAKVKDLLFLSRQPVDVDNETAYKAVGIRSFGKGMIFYPPSRGDQLSKLRYFKFPGEALAISNIKAWEGAVAVTPHATSEYVASNRFLFYLPKEDSIDVRFACYYLISEEGLYQIGLASPGSADRNRTLAVDRFAEVRIPVPPKDVQQRVVAMLDKVHKEWVQALERRNALRAALRSSALNAAFTGKL